MLPEVSHSVHASIESDIQCKLSLETTAMRTPVLKDHVLGR